MAALSIPPRFRARSVWALYAIGLIPGLYAFYLGINGGLGADPCANSNIGWASGRCASFVSG